MSADREGFDLWNKHCRMNLRLRFRRGFWRGLKITPWRLVISDTWNRVCSKNGGNQ